MKHHILYFCLLTSVIFFHIIIKAEKVFNPLDQKIYVRGVQCNFSERFVYPNYTCYAKSYNRSFSTINVRAFMKKPVNKIFFSMKLYYKYVTVYREVMQFPRFEFCSLMDFGTSNKLSLEIKDQPIVSETIPSLIPSGDYKMTFSWYTEKGVWFQHTTDYLTVDSPLKESFGK
ncbi:CLUMA_CG007925, isoform A [Clunio marinus]|uniref:CLUMA_CG007925, isoform A n=1 Tax=Clunio marinus TaxID=568069 RepID=A0A1J1I3T3_9DIPT|nr:CLUMA_CG007925, isoform A [Clunio marinus]